MRSLRRLGALIVLAVVLAPAQLASAKGAVSVTIRGPGLGTPIHLSGDEAESWMDDTGSYELKWNVPNVDGRLRRNVDLGVGYPVRVRMDYNCAPGHHGTFEETLYPYAPGGPQIFVAKGTKVCTFDPMPAGYFPTAHALLPRLQADGLPAPTTLPASVTAQESARASGSSSGIAPTVPILALMTGLGLATFGLAWRRRRVAG